jgi:hypothetical protein
MHRWVRALLLAGSWLAPIGQADPLHAIGGGDFQHHDSGWVFPQQIAGFVRQGAPQDVDGSSDAVAYYTRDIGEMRSSAVVDLYPPDSAAQMQMAGEVASGPAAAQGTLKVGTQRTLTALKFVRGGSALYFIDTGSWIVKIRISAAALDARTVQACDDFVRQQRWDSLGLSDETCTGPACSHASQ